MSDKIYTIDEIKLVLQKVLANLPVYQVTLFGSYAKNSASQTSDIDLLIDTRSTLMGLKLLSLIGQLEEAFNKPVEVFEKIEIIENSKVDMEIKRTGVVVYEK